MSEREPRPIVDVTLRYNSARAVTKRVWLALVVHREGGLTLDQLCAMSGDDLSSVQNALADLNATDQVIEQLGSHYRPKVDLLIEEDAFFHEELVQHLIATGQDRAAIDLLYRTALLHQKLGDVPGQADDLGNIGALMLRSQQFDKARAMFTDALSLHETQNLTVGQARDWANLGVIAGYKGELDEAQRCLIRAKQLFERAGEDEMVARTQQNMDEIQRIAGKTE
jgi:tetratricopeptide (TPR) repeat protein